MKLNSISPGPGSKKTRLRVGRGASAGQGKTCGRGVKGQRARKGGYHKVGFEGGQMPLQRRLPKVGFRSAASKLVAEVRLNELGYVKDGMIDLESLKKAALGNENGYTVRIGQLPGTSEDSSVRAGFGHRRPSQHKCAVTDRFQQLRHGISHFGTRYASSTLQLAPSRFEWLIAG